MITKRQLGIIFIILSLLAVMGSFVFDLVGGGQFKGIGPTQKIGLAAAGVIFFVGLTLLPLGDKPA